MTIALALRAAGLGGCGGLGGIDALECLGIGTLDKDEARPRLGKGIELLALPCGNGLEPRRLDVLVRQARDDVVAPNHRHVTRTGGVSARYNDAHESGHLDGRLDHHFLTGFDVHAFSHDEIGISLELGLQVDHARTSLLDGKLRFEH